MMTNKKPQAKKRSTTSTSTSPYQEAASLINELLFSGRPVSLKSLIYDPHNGHLRCSKRTYALASETLKHQTILRALSHQVDNVKNQGLLYVLLYELLLGRKKDTKNQSSIQGGGALKRKILKVEPSLRKALAELRGTHYDDNADAEGVMVLPRYLRVNSLKASMEEIVQKIKSILQTDDDTNVLTVSFFIDPHIPDLLVLPPSSTAAIQANPELVHKIVLQDKSSCFPAYCLVHGFSATNDREGPNTNNYPQHCDYLDACAAPGNKTSHLAALLQQCAVNQPSQQPRRIFALDQSFSRCASLQSRMQHLVPSNCESMLVQVDCRNIDFLQTNPDDYASVGSLLLDPTCSGSGLRTNKHNSEQDSNNDARLQSLSNFQVTALKHAMSFPHVQRIVYSTCSIHCIENEQVVEQAIRHSRQQEVNEGGNDCVSWEIVAPLCLESWHRRGLACDGLTSKETASMIRVDQSEDETNGFFVCCLQRRQCANKGEEHARNLSVNEAKAQDSFSLPLSKAAESLGVLLYNGEFASNISLSTGERRAIQPPPTPVLETEKKHRGNGKKQAFEQHPPSRPPDGHNSGVVLQKPSIAPSLEKKPGNAVVSKKQQKKKAWKRQQHLAKQSRLSSTKNV